MSTKMGLAFTLGAVVLALSMGYSLQAQSGAVPLDKIGVVSIVKVMYQSKAYTAAMGALSAEGGRHQAELQALAQELDTDRASLQAIVAGTEDHLKQLQTVYDKQAKLDSRREYYQQLLQAKEKDATEKAYQAALAATQRVADSKGLTLVLEQSPPEFPVPGERLLFTIAGHKVLYSKGCVDITDAVLAEVDR